MNSYLIAGLGNPGEKYNDTRHNIGFKIVDAFCDSFGEQDSFSSNKKHQCEICTLGVLEQKIIVAKPQAFMNNSGGSVQSLREYFDIDTDKILLVHDDLDLPFGKIRFSKDSGAAGHNGVKSVISHLNTKNFARLRFGIKLEQSFLGKFLLQPKGKSFVLGKFSKKENAQLEEILPDAVSAIKTFVTEGFENSTKKFN